MSKRKIDTCAYSADKNKESAVCTWHVNNGISVISPRVDTETCAKCKNHKDKSK